MKYTVTHVAGTPRSSRLPRAPFSVSAETAAPLRDIIPRKESRGEQLERARWARSLNSLKRY
jgi:hypothetical protein